MKYPLYIVDVFAEAKYEGNQLAVVFDEIGIERAPSENKYPQQQPSFILHIAGHLLCGCGTRGA